MAHFLVYVRRSYRATGDTDISDEAQVAASLSVLPDGATHEVIADSGGHHSGATDERDGYRELIRRVREGGIAGIAVYDLSRLARNASLMLPLRDELERRNVEIRVGVMPQSRFDGAIGRFMFGQLCLAAQLQRDLDSERMTKLTRTLFEDGRHRGQDPFGYRSTRDAEGRRQLVVEPTEAAEVRLIFRELATRSYGDIAAAYGWTPARVKDVARRARVYLGFVVEARGRDERPGRHEPIIDDETYRAAMAGILERQRGRVRRPPKRRVYVLSGVLHCAECAARMVGQTQSSRGREWRYYICRRCPAPSVPGDEAERDVLDRIATMQLPRHAIDAARAELRRRLAVPSGGLVDRQRRRLEARLVALRKQHGWGDIDDAEYRREVAAARAQLATLPDGDKVVLFDRWRGIVESLADSVAHATPAEHAQLVRLLVERVEARGRVVVDVVWTPPARPFFGAITSAPPDGFAETVGEAALDWYDEAIG